MSKANNLFLLEVLTIFSRFCLKSGLKIYFLFSLPTRLLVS